MPGDGAAPPRESLAAADGSSGTPDATAVSGLVATVRDLAASSGRDDLAARLTAVGRRIDRTDTVICVVGEFKQGKSALINALLGADVCPVDDDLATATVTTLRHGAQPSATVHRRVAGVETLEAVEPMDLARWVTERGDPRDRLAVELVEVTLPHPLLARGITLVDTPGIGGLNAAHAAATLAFLPIADALVFVSDASAELTGPELGFLSSAVDAGPLVVVALTKIDMYPEWRRILEIDERHLRDIELATRPHPVSAILSAVGAASGDDALERESGVPSFAGIILDEVARRARAASFAVAFQEVRDVLDQLREPVMAERAALDHPEAASRYAAELADIQARSAALEEAGAHWSVRLDDEFLGLRTRVEFSFAAEMRRILRDAQDEIERIDPGREWDDLSRRVQAQVADAVKGAFDDTTEGAAGIQTAVARLLADEDSAWTTDDAPVAFDASSLWTEGQAFGGMLQTGLLAGFGLLAGATVGVEMLGMLGALLGTALVGPALLGAALFFGGKEVAGERRRQLTDRRQEARTFVARFVENVRFEVDGRLTSLEGTLQRDMRARFAARIAELRRTHRATADAIERSMTQDAADRERRSRELETTFGVLERATVTAIELEGAWSRAA